MGASYSIESDLQIVLHRAVLSSSKLLVWSKTRRVEEVLSRIFSEIDVGNTGKITKQGFLKAAALLEIEEDYKVLMSVFDRLDTNSIGYLEKDHLLSFTRFKKNKKIKKGTDHINEIIDSPHIWRETLAGFQENLEGIRRPKLLKNPGNENPNWEIKSERWESKLQKAEERRRKRFPSAYPAPSPPTKPIQKQKRNKPKTFQGRKLMVNEVGGSTGDGNTRSNMLVSEVGNSRVPKNARRTRYLESVAQTSSLVELQDITHFSVEDLEKLREKFFETALSSSLSVERFCEFLTKEYPQLAGHQALLLRLFTLFDEDGNGTVSFQEFIIGMTKTVNCSFEDKLNLMFSCIDLSSDGNINLQELTHVLSKSQGDVQASIAFSRDFFSYLDRDENGSISLGEFKNSLQGNPTLFRSLMRALPLPTSASDLMDELQRAHDSDGFSFSLDSLKSLYKEYSKAQRRNKNKQKEMSRGEFRQIMARHFGYKRLDQIKLLDKLFDTFDTDNSDSVTFEEILRGLSLLINQKNGEEDSEDCLNFYFDLCDSDKTGSVVDADIINILQTTEQKVEKDYVETKNMLETLSKKKETISEKELRNLSESHPQLFNMLRHNFC